MSAGRLSDLAVRVGVVGLGAFGRHHARHLDAAPGARLIGVCDKDRATAQAAAERYGCAIFDDPDAMAREVEAVCIAVPAVVHGDVAGGFLDAGIHVLIEKPITSDMDAAHDLIARAEKSGVVLQVGHVERFSPAIREMMAAGVRPRRIACVRHAPWTGRSSDVDVVLDMMIHDIDHALVLAGSKVVSVSASGRVVASGMIDEAEAWLTFANGAVATLSASRVAEAPRRVMTVTEAGRVFAADLAEPSLSVTDRHSGDITQVTLQPNDNLGDEIAAFLASVGRGAPVAVDGRAGMNALAVATEIQTAMHEELNPVSESLPS